jgi:hypothetical protein
MKRVSTMRRPPRASQTNDSSSVRQEQVPGRVYEIYEQRGKENGHDLDDWLRAESEITQQFRRRKNHGSDI